LSQHSPRYQGLAVDEVTYSAMLAAYARSGAGKYYGGWLRNPQLKTLANIPLFIGFRNHPQ
jgi:hypothetical protein